MTRLGSSVKTGFLILIFTIPFFPPVPVAAQITCSAAQSPSWQICGPIVPVSGVNQEPSATQANDGTLRLAWQHITPTGLSSINYNTRLTNGTWLAGSQVTNLGGFNEFPSIVQAANGTIFIFWAYKAVGADHFQIYYRYLKGTVWSPYHPLPLSGPQTNMNDTLPTTAVDNSGTLWLAWTRDNTTAVGTQPVMRQLWYKTLTAAGWSAEQSITSSSDVNWNLQPSIIQGKDGIVRIAYSRGQGGAFQINYIRRQGPSWSAPLNITGNSTTNDMSPSLMQDRNGTLWVFWTRAESANFVIRARNSTDNGAHWGAETALTCSGCSVDSQQPAAVQSSTDKNIWVFYSTNPGASFNVWALKTTNKIYPVHDVSITCLSYCYTSYSASTMYAGGFPGPYAGQSPIEQIFVTVRNFGDFVENVSLSLAATNVTKFFLGIQYLSVQNGTSGTFFYNWNTTGARAGRYGISANVTIPGESFANMSDDNLTLTNQIHLLPLGDVNQDGAITIVDISIARFDYAATPGSPRWNPYADITGGGIISIVDINYINFHYGIYT